MAKPSSKGPSKTIDVFCKACNTRLYKYLKGGKGTLVKCFKERISRNYTLIPCICPKCEQTFARDTLVNGTPAYKFIGGKVWSK